VSFGKKEPPKENVRRVFLGRYSCLDKATTSRDALKKTFKKTQPPPLSKETCGGPFRTIDFGHHHRIMFEKKWTKELLASTGFLAYYKSFSINSKNIPLRINNLSFFLSIQFN
jgi:hypothetical protein